MESFKTFTVYCGLALHHAKLYDKIRRSEQKYKVHYKNLHSTGSFSWNDSILKICNGIQYIFGVESWIFQ